MKGLSFRRHFWIGIWMIPFALIAGVLIVFIATGVRGGFQNLGRGRAAFALVGLIVLILAYVISSGWVSDNAVSLVKIRMIRLGSEIERLCLGVLIQLEAVTPRPLF